MPYHRAMRAIWWMPLLSGVGACGLVLDFGRLQDDGSGASATVTSAGPTTASASNPEGSTGSGLLDLGASCEDAAACASGFCAGGICCDAACEGPCRACSPMGTCGVRAAGLACAAGSCTDGVLHPESSCSASGECAAPPDVPCIEDACAGALCAGCTPGSCPASDYCPPEGGSCKPKLALGATCSSAAACASGSCADGVCCDAACDGTCEACDAAGHCAPFDAGDDPDEECITGAGCGLTGACSGASSCALVPAATSCGAPSCSGGTLTLAPSCDGAGSCVGGATASCGNYACNDGGTACRSDCTAPAHCTNGTTCIVGQCRASDGVGNACPNGASDCPLGFCVDGFCCRNACTGACTACSNVRTGAANGECAAVVDFTDPKGSCEENPSTPCGLSGVCVTGQCALQPAGTPCGETCVGNGYIGLSCDGTGMCDYNSTGYQDCGSSVNCCVRANGDITCAEPGNCS